VRGFSRRYPQLGYDEALCEAVRIAMAVERTFDPKLGHDFSTLLRKHLKGLSRFAKRMSVDDATEIYQTKEELARIAAEEEHRLPAPSFRGGNGTRLTADFQWLESGRHRRVQLGVRLSQVDEGHARGVSDRVGPDIKAVLDHPARPDPILRGYLRAAFDHNERRQREADQEAENRKLGDHGPVFLEAKDSDPDIKFHKGRRPYKYRPTHMPMARLDDAYGHDDAWRGSLHDVIAAGAPRSDAERQEALILDAAGAIRPFRSKREIPVLDWMVGQLTGTDTRNQALLAMDIGMTPGAVTKIRDRLATELRRHLEK
jgi:hypothetical protein